MVTEKHSKATSIQHLSHYGYEREVLGSRTERWQLVKMKKEDEYTYIYVKPS